ncbi:hypothetical protein cyc_00576 [Cyclospora cayetanensis]|uniref:Uncharacterized protein n=1 Tax=Cyclospora cayetanensis TaxID=88456 RepID=A0A1D3CYP7_9EIME|nr:hypothetical protein cyc_00576 [Cyclospora cayetanensis]
MAAPAASLPCMARLRGTRESSNLSLSPSVAALFMMARHPLHSALSLSPESKEKGAPAVAAALGAVAKGLALSLTPKETQQFAASIVGDLELALNALVVASHAASPSPPREQLESSFRLPLSALREDKPQLYYGRIPPKICEKNSPASSLPPWSREACECQETDGAQSATGEGFLPPPPYFGFLAQVD